MAWKEQNIVSLRSQFIEQVFEKSKNITELCFQFGISRQTAYKWIKRYREDGLEGLMNQSTRPHTSPNKIPCSQVKLILQIREKHPDWGGRKLREVLVNEGYKNIPSEPTFNRILKIHEKIDPEESQKRKKCIRFEHEHPNDLWQMDFKGHFQMLNKRCHPFTIMDDHSRFAICLKGLINEEGCLVKRVLEEIFTEYGLPLRMTMDNGPQWKTGSKISVWLMRLGISVSHSRPFHPQTQGKLERFHRTFKLEVLKNRLFTDIETAQQEFDDWKEIYNYLRPHEGMNMDCPGDRYIKSDRIYKGLLPIEYEPEDILRKVQICGQISYCGKHYYVGEHLKGEYVGLRQMKEDSLEIYFMKTRLSKIMLR